MNRFANNVFANYFNKIFTAIIGILTVPFLIRILGPESYGVASIYAIFQSIILIFDLGWTALNGRQVAGLRSGSLNKQDFDNYFKSLQIIFHITVLVLFFFVMLFSNNIVRFLNFESIEVHDLGILISVMFLTASIKFLSSLYRSTLVAYERQVESSFLNVTVIFFKYVAPLPVMYFSDLRLSFYIIWQFLVSLVEYLYLSKSITKSTHLKSYEFVFGASFEPLKKVFSFSFTIAVTSFLWILASQIDKILVVTIFSLKEYGFYAALILCASAIQMISYPISSAYRPKINILFQSKDQKDAGENSLITLTKLIAIVTTTAASFIYLNSLDIVKILIGSSLQEPQLYSDMLKALVAGSLILTFNSILYFYQVAIGNLKWHLIASIIYPTILIPLAFILMENLGIIGLTYSIVISNFIIFLLVIFIFWRLNFKRLANWIQLILLIQILIWCPSIIIELLLNNIFQYENSIAKMAFQFILHIIIFMVVTIIVFKGLRKIKTPIRSIEKIIKQNL